MDIPFRTKQPRQVVGWLKQRLFLIFNLGLILFMLSIVVGVYAFDSQRTLDDKKVVLREDSDAVLNAMINQETGLQGYISTKNTVFLESFQQGRSEYLNALQDFTTQIETGPFRHTATRLAVMQDVADDWYTNYAVVQLNKIQVGNLAGPRSEGSIIQGKEIFDRFRSTVAQVQDSIGQDLEVYQSQVDTVNLSLLLGALVLTLGVSTGLWWLMRTFTAQLHTQLECLTQTAQRLGQGERTARVEPLAFTDLNQVGQSFNRMADALKQDEDTIEEHLHTLESQYALVEQAQGESRAILDASSESFLFISTSGQVQAVNRPFREFFALAAKGIVGMPLADLQRLWEPLFVNAASLHDNLVQDLNNQERSYTMNLIQKEPQYRELAVYSTPVHSSTSTYLGRLYVLRDITQEREAEQLKSKFYSMVSHGLRSPLTSIKGYTDLLMEEGTGPLTDLQEEFLSIVQSDVQRLIALVNDLLDLPRLESHTIIVTMAPLDLHHLIHELTQAFRPQVEDRQQRLSLYLGASPLMVLGDENRVGQILTNLLTFASSHTPIGGRIDWATQQEDSMASIILRTTGNLSAEELALFDHPFFYAPGQTHSETAERLLGPSITRSLVELHGGVLQVMSEFGKGTTFTCMLPLAPPRALALAPGAALDSSSSTQISV